MESYGYAYPPSFPPMGPTEGAFPDHGDGFGDYYGLSSLTEERDISRRRSRSRHRANNRRTKRPRSPTTSLNKTRTRSRSRSRSKSRSRTRSRSRSRTRSRSRSGSQRRKHSYREPGLLDSFRVLYLTPSKHKKSTTKYLATKKRQDRIQELLKSDGLGSKKWLFYPRPEVTRNQSEPPEAREVTEPRDSCDQRVKIDGEFFRKYKRRSKVDSDAPIAKLKRWELILYKKLGFIQAI
ncbi:hypothetical protein evm_009691 [Chilo suppressalis]|nr:hypothetical protein evm_009691 [Chilo suppressalis]